MGKILGVKVYSVHVLVWRILRSVTGCSSIGRVGASPSVRTIGAILIGGLPTFYARAGTSTPSIMLYRVCMY